MSRRQQIVTIKQLVEKLQEYDENLLVVFLNEGREIYVDSDFKIVNNKLEIPVEDYCNWIWS